MWLVLFTIPFLKYPANPPTVGDAETVMLRGVLYLSFIAISGFSVLGFYQMYKRLQQKKVLAFVGYGLFITAVFFLMPDNPDKTTASMELVNGFRIFSFLSTSVFWLSLALILGAFWEKLKPQIHSG
jgi:predicted cobalt transporter CbtA